MSLRWYAHYLQDYEDATRDLSMQQDGCYRRLLDHCYKTEGALPAALPAIHRIARAMTRSERADVSFILNRYFTLGPDWWRNKRVDQELRKTGDISQKRSQAASNRHANASPKAHANGHANAGAIADTLTVTSSVETRVSTSDNPRKRGPKPKTSLPDPFPLEANLDWAREHWLEHHRGDLCNVIEDQAAGFRDYHSAHDTRSADWDASWRTWAKNAMKFNSRESNGQSRRPTPHETLQSASVIALQRIIANE